MKVKYLNAHRIVRTKQMYHLTEATDRATMNKMLSDVQGVYGAVLDHMLENGIRHEDEMSDETLRNIMIDWVGDGDETYKH